MCEVLTVHINPVCKHTPFKHLSLGEGAQGASCVLKTKTCNVTHAVLED